MLSIQELRTLIMSSASFFLKLLKQPLSWKPETSLEDSKFLSWRLAVEANNFRGFQTVPLPFPIHINKYMSSGQYDLDVETAVEQMLQYAYSIAVVENSKDAWVFDVDDTCLSNLEFMKFKRFGIDPFHHGDFINWTMQGKCTAVPAVLGLYKKVIERGFKVFFITGRDEEVMGPVTARNLEEQGYLGYERLIMRTQTYKGFGAAQYKSAIRKQLLAEGYNIRGNVGDQWSDLTGDCVGDRAFKVPNPVYFVS